ncbi:hypothetical protein CQ019_18040, partial [Arthrobacter sp. MYb229]|uniref:hypothetical protein n=1 Tax=unclassified Arthrobacter TaxID=235627 RepID=UPI000D4BF3D5
LFSQFRITFSLLMTLNYWPLDEIPGLGKTGRIWYWIERRHIQTPVYRSSESFHKVALKLRNMRKFNGFQDCPAIGWNMLAIINDRPHASISPMKSQRCHTRV